MKTTVSDFDIVDYLETPEDMQAYLQVCLEEDGVKGLQHALGMIARAQGMNELAQKTGLGRQNLYRALNKNVDPKISTIDKVIKAMGFHLTIAPAI